MDGLKPSNAVVIGLTGGIASGKSTVCKYLEDKGQAVVVNADLMGHEAYAPGTECNKEMVEHFGERILNKEDGSINRKALGPIVFADKNELEALNRIVWPAIRKLIVDKIGSLSRNGEEEDPENKNLKIIVLEAAIMLEAGWQDLVDEVWVISAQKEIAKERLMKRNNMNEEQAMSRINSQMSTEDRLKHGHVHVANDGDQKELLDKLKEEVIKLKSRYSKQSAFELVDIVDDQDQVIGTAKRAVVRTFNLASRASYVVLVHKPTNEIYVQQRSKLKDYGPGLLDPAPGGVVGAGESYLDNAKREMEEELGLSNIVLKHVATFWFQDSQTKSWGTVFTASIETPIDQLQLQKEEVESVKLMNIEEILSMEPELFLPDGLEAFKLFQSKL